MHSKHSEFHRYELSSHFLYFLFNFSKIECVCGGKYDKKTAIQFNKWGCDVNEILYAVSGSFSIHF